MRVAIIPADTEKRIEFKDIESKLSEYQKIVGGYIEAVRLVDNNVSVAMDYYVNEDGIAEGLPYNERATRLYELSFGVRGYILGDAVAIGGIDQYGNDKGLSAAQETHLKAFDEMYDEWRL